MQMFIFVHGTASLVSLRTFLPSNHFRWPLNKAQTNYCVTLTPQVFHAYSLGEKEEESSKALDLVLELHSFSNGRCWMGASEYGQPRYAGRNAAKYCVTTHKCVASMVVFISKMYLKPLVALPFATLSHMLWLLLYQWRN